MGTDTVGDLAIDTAIDTVNGLPAHVLLVHAVVILLPLAALVLVLAVLWPAAQRRLGVVTPLLALVGLVLVPVTTQAGEWLEANLGGTSELIERHAGLGDQLLPYAIGLFVVALAHWVFVRFVVARRVTATTSAPAAGSGGGGGTAVAERTTAPADARVLVGRIVFAVLGVAAAALTVWMVYRVGDSGAQAVWQGTVAS